MRRWRKVADYSIDDDVNMGYIQLRRQRPRRFVRSLGVRDNQGRTQFVLDVEADGTLLGIECFDAAALGSPPR